MAEYLAARIKRGYLDYDTIVNSKLYARYKDEIDRIFEKEDAE